MDGEVDADQRLGERIVAETGLDLEPRVGRSQAAEERREELGR